MLVWQTALVLVSEVALVLASEVAFVSVRETVFVLVRVTEVLVWQQADTTGYCHCLATIATIPQRYSWEC